MPQERRRSSQRLKTPEGKPVRLKLRRVTSFCGHAISTFAKRSLDPDCAVVSDGLQYFGRVKDAGCSHEVIITGSGPRSVRGPAFKWVNTALGNIKSAIVGTYRSISEVNMCRATSPSSEMPASTDDTISLR